ncbi:MAG TPA: hypothetical protein VMT54_18655 [Candidatus Cybelea sp.]|nr:hypothetical protein [Candidatus Cybelea sp.]
MRSLRYLVAGILGLGAAIGTYYAINQSNLGSDLEGGLYSGLVMYPACVLVFAIAFWIVFAAMDPGSEQ